MQHIMKGKEVTVQRYPVGTKIPEIFSGKSDDTNNQEIDAMVFRSVPIILRFIYTVPMYKKRIQSIESDFNVTINVIDDGLKVAISPLPGCTRRKHDDACEEYFVLYREVYDGPMMSKYIILTPALSVKEAAIKQLRMETVAIQAIDVPDDELPFYGKEANVRSAINAVCNKTLKNDYPCCPLQIRELRKLYLRLGNVQHVQGKDENHYIGKFVK
ncbi:uncharacterized protein LOC116309116 [Actinia tenebrosa]|uniref:Uncharacterized protein LOC116309116 n=1 Tax=Actinia tenebrosa TaxID=6105 RepID=A0A6P8J6W1_ACTTE|nr:uncharacterized protein LOC116309116 [Actinia tenebrosa]XP_031575542.1 uncharacterized protein LOC116309116 [Actinia tenebrosa]